MDNFIPIIQNRLILLIRQYNLNDCNFLGVSPPILFILLILLNKLPLPSFILSITSTEIYSKIFIPNDIYFHVYRNGTKIGYHKINFSLKTNENKSNLINANVEIDFDVQFLGFSIYSY